MSGAYFSLIHSFDFEVYQFSSVGVSQSMGYIFRNWTPIVGGCVVLDGGTKAEADQIEKYLQKLCDGQVDAWVLSHPHSDHAGVLLELMRRKKPVRIGRVLASLPTVEWVRQFDSWEVETVEAVWALRKSGDVLFRDLSKGEEVRAGGVRFRVLGVRNPEIKANGVNNSSVVLRVEDGSRSFLFLGDLGEEGGEKLLREYEKTGLLRVTHVQMAHHGQAGVRDDVYKAVGASTCMWPTPRWLWDNDSGKGPGSGPWLTPRMLQVVEELGCKHHVKAFEGVVRVE
jgi:glyoxylase-like metal-dependent hydrolase (beta-lactamase superfamily II)